MLVSLGFLLVRVTLVLSTKYGTILVIFTIFLVELIDY